MRPVMSSWYASVCARQDTLPRPTDEPVGHVAGSEPVRVLILGGDGPPIGWGVMSHGLALPGQMARELSSRTGRGAHVAVLAEPSTHLAAIPRAVAGHSLAGYDVIMVMPGAREAITLVSPTVWRNSVQGVMRMLSVTASPHARLVFVGSQPIRSIPVFDSMLAQVAARHRLLLNQIAEDICSGIPAASYLPLPAQAEPEPGRYRSPGEYQFWAAALTEHVLGVLPSVKA